MSLPDGTSCCSLADLEKAIQQQGHLPGIPSEAEALADGVRLGDMQVKLLEKVEDSVDSAVDSSADELQGVIVL